MSSTFRLLSALLALGSLLSTVQAQAPQPADRNPAINLARAMMQVQVNRQVANGNVGRRGPARADGIVSGKVVGVDTARNLIQLELPQGEVSYTLAPGVTVFVDNAGGQLADVASGNGAQLRINQETHEVVEVRTGRNVAVRDGRNGLNGVNAMNVAMNNGRIVVNGVEINANGARVVQIINGRILVDGVEINNPGAGRGAGVWGKVVGVDTARNTVTLELPQGEVSYPLAPEAKVLLEGGKEGRLADVLSGQGAVVRLDGEPKQVVELQTGRANVGRDVARPLRIVADALNRNPVDPRLPNVLPLPALPELPQLNRAADRVPTQHGQLIGVDTARNTLTIKLANRAGGEKTFEVADKVSILVNGGKPGKLDDIGAGAVVAFKLDAAGKKVVELRAEPTTMRVPLEAVDPVKKTLTIGNAKKEQKIYEVAADAQVTVNSKNVPLEELKPGIPVTLQIAANGKTVLRVVATDRRKGAQ
jgi:hypothetical protein